MMISVIIFGVIAYLIGSLSSAIIVCKLLKLPDPRTQGSMNPGATNVLRIGGKTPALITLAGDMLKGFLPVLVGHLVGISGFFLGLIAVAAFLGHLYPAFFKFQGGKGVATAAGAILALSPIVGVAAIISWLLVAAAFRYSSLAALASAIATPIFMLFLGDKAYLLPMLIITAMLIWNHRDNIQRLRSGSESKISF
ncbi:putative glycerol-3-phosphate acyltransferase [Gammaproteobacteria bacterium]